MAAEQQFLGASLARGFKPSSTKWPLVRSSALFELRYGKALVESQRRPGAVPVFGTNGRCGFHDKALFRGPGVVLGRKGQGPLGVEWADTDYWVIDTAYSVQPLEPDLDLRFAYYLIKYVGLNHLKDGTSNPSLTRDTFGAQLFPMPPPRTQTRIVQILKTLDDKIELNRRRNETLEAMARGLFKSWFVDFDPVRAKAEDRAPAGMDADIAKVFPSVLVNSELGRIPKGWSIEPIGEVVRVVGGSTPSTGEPSYWAGGTIAWATPKDLSSVTAPVLLRTGRCVTERGLAQISSGLLPSGTVLLSSRAPIGYIAIAQIPLAINQGFIAIPPSAALPAEHLVFWLRFNMDQILARAGGTTFAEISKSNFRPIPVIVPDAEVLRAYSRASAPILTMIARGERESWTLTQIRDALLPRLLSGELPIGPIEREHSNE